MELHHHRMTVKVQTKMALTTGISVRYCLPVLVLVFGATLETCWADFNEEWCLSFIPDGVNPDDPMVTPYFFDNYYYIGEEIVFVDDDRDNNQVVEPETTFSREMEQVALYRRDKHGTYSAWADAHYNDLIERNYGDDVCMDSELTDWIFADTYITASSSAPSGVKLVTGRESLGWINSTMKISAADLASSVTRGIRSDKYITCNYDTGDDSTTVRLWYFLDTNAVKSMQGENAVLLKTVHVKRIGTEENNVEDFILEYTNFQQLSDSVISERLQLPENACGYIGSPALVEKVPMPPSHFNVYMEIGAAKDYSTTEYTLYFEHHDFNTETKIFYTVLEMESSSRTSGVEIVTNVEDFNTGYLYAFEEATGWCAAEIAYGFRMGYRDEDGNPVMKTPEEYWYMDADKTKAHLGRYDNRDIPTEMWRFTPQPDEDGKVYSYEELYLANDEWLQTQGYAEETFYPIQLVEVTSEGENHRYYSYYEYKPNPGYFIPDVSACFHSEDILTAVMAFTADYYASILPYEAEFDKAFRTTFLKFSGIVSQIRIPKITFTQSSTTQGETVVTFTVLGRVLATEYTDPKYQELDPVPSMDAVKNVNDAIDAGLFVVTLITKVGSVELTAKPQSMYYLDQDTEFVNVDDPDVILGQSSSSGAYGSGSMAALGICMLLIGLALGVFLLLFYKRYTENGRSISGIVTMSKLGEA